ncbi:hypothetical protein JW887_06630 [Candidatus Dojkabacteria bacterium]|nr:hypothetical protein [Candidatus Dojkabacteria bacterium]
MVDPFDFFTLKNAFSVLMLVLLFGYCIFSLLLMLRVRILSQTVETKLGGFINFLARAHLVFVVAASIVIAILVLI